MKVHITPKYRGADDGSGGGIRRVVEAQRKYLPDFGVEVIDTPVGADVINAHAGTTRTSGIPMCASIHGLYWTAEESWPNWAWTMNQQVIDSMLAAKVVTVPSEWVAHAVRRGSLIDPVVIPHGIDIDEWTPGESQGYVLWNKFRIDPACDPSDMNALAVRSPGTKFVSTFGATGPNVTLTDRVPPEEMRELVRNAGVYLCTARETFGIGTLEAMASGVPVLAWRHGAQVEYVPHLEAGYLATPGDIDDLVEGLAYCQQHRDRLGDAAREVAGRFTWPDAIAQYVDAFKRAAEPRPVGPQVSIVIRCYNYGATLDRAVRSALAQTHKDFEVVIVDDASTDQTPQVAAQLARDDARVRVVTNAANRGLAGASNAGIGASRGRYYIQLDADDELHPRAVEWFADALDKDPTTAIAYGAMEVLTEQGTRFKSGWPPEFDWRQQLMGRNQVCYSAMVRREAWERVGGHRAHSAPAEDADLWTRATSFGFKARRVTQASTLLKHDHSDSASNARATPSWPQWFGWARDIRAVPFTATGVPIQSQPSWPVRSFDTPKVSIIIPVGPGHGAILQDALDSLLAQGEPDWEAIVVDDTGGEPLATQGAPWAKVIRTRGREGVAVARNLGIAAAKAPALIFLDADDFLQPDCLRLALDAHEQCPDNVIVWDWYQQKADGTLERQNVLSEDTDAVRGKAQHVVTALYPTDAVREVGGFDSAVAWEDWDLAIALRSKGWCMARLPEPLLTYRLGTGVRREDAYANRTERLAAIHAKWGNLAERNDFMACRGCGGRINSGPAPMGAQAQTNGARLAQSGEAVLVEYVGGQRGKFRVKGRVTRTEYVFSAGPPHQQKYVDPQDAEHLIKIQGFRQAQIVTAPPMGPTPEAGAPVVLASASLRTQMKSATPGEIPIEPLPNLQASTGDFGDLGELTVQQIRDQAPTMGARQLTVWLDMETKGKARATVLRLLETAIASETAAQGAK